MTPINTITRAVPRIPIIRLFTSIDFMIDPLIEVNKPPPTPAPFPPVVPLSGVEFSIQNPLFANRIKDQGLEPSNLKIQDPVI